MTFEAMTNQPSTHPMKSHVPSRPAALRLSRAAASALLRPACALTLCLALSQPAAAAVEAGSGPKDWPANPAKHQITVRREAADKQQSAMIAAAEAAQPARKVLLEAAGTAGVPAGDKVWWYKEELGIRIPCAITGDAIAYYSDLVGKYGKQALKRHAEPSSHLDYHATVAFHKEFLHQGQTFKDVHVVTLKLSFSQNFAATQTEGMEFQKVRTVVLNADGKVLHITGDGPTEVPILAI